MSEDRFRRKEAKYIIERFGYCDALAKNYIKAIGKMRAMNDAKWIKDYFFSVCS